MTSSKRPPNVLFLMSDEHRADVTGYEGNQVVKTPTLDKIAKTGVVFKNAYTPSPICVPARQAMMSGQLPRTCKCEHYGDDLAPEYMTFAKRFSQAGYHTAAAGKLHHMGTDQMQGWLERIAGDVHLAPRYIEDLDKDTSEKYSPGRQKWSDKKEVLRAGPGLGHHQKKDLLTVKGALNFIDEYFTSPMYDREQLKRPLMLKVSLNQPHYPYYTSQEKFTYYLNRVEQYENQQVFDHPFLGQRSVKIGEDVSSRDVQRAVAAYYGMIETADELFGRVIERLEHVGQNLDDWIVVYTSDHGEMLGEHGIWEKQKFFEGSVRIPLLISWPAAFEGGKIIRENVNHCDLFATLCELAGLSVPENLDSRSLVPLMKGNRTGWNNETVSQFMGRNLMVKQDNLKYQYYGEEMPKVLFDLENDPGENENFINDPDYAEAVKKFKKRRSELGFGPDAPEYVNAGY